MQARRKYILPNGKAISLEPIDFGLYLVAYNGKTLREFYCVQQAKVYFDRTIAFALHHEANRKFKHAA